MAADYTFIVFVNRFLKRVKAIEGDAGEISTFTDSARQHEIDVAQQIINEGIHALYGLGTFQGEVAIGTITFATGTKDYAVPTDFEGMAGEYWKDRVMISATTGARIYEYVGGYERMFRDQPIPADITGFPNRWALKKVDSTFTFDNTPTSDENGEVVTFLYEKLIQLVATSDTFPVSNTVMDALLPVMAEMYHIDIQGKERNPINAFSGFKTAIRLAIETKSRKFYGTERIPGRKVA